MDGILWILRTGSPWRDLPKEFGPWQTVERLFDKWNGDGTLSKIVYRLCGVFVDIGEIDKDLWCIGGTIVRAARCASGGGKKGLRLIIPTTENEDRDARPVEFDREEYRR